MHITKPTLLLDTAKCLRNIETMSAKARRHKVAFRPHFKTHQSREIGRWFKKQSVQAITVSSLTMAAYFADDGWNDITVAFPVNILEIDTINALAKRITLNLLVESVESVSVLRDNLRHPCGVFIKIDSGYGRTGISSDRTNEIDRLLDEIKKSTLLQFKGFLTHAGHTYHARSRDEIMHIHRETVSKMVDLKKRYGASYPKLQISIGDTPSCSVVENFLGIDEIRPGNFVFYDVMQRQIGSCSYDQVAVAMACPVVATHPERNEAIIYGGGVHFSKDFILDQEGKKQFGLIVDLHERGWSQPVDHAFVSSLSQEHGVIKADRAYIERLHVGDVIGILPVHSCLTAECMGEYRTFDGQTIDHCARGSMVMKSSSQ